MPCDAIRTRQAPRVKTALEKLEAALSRGDVRLKVKASGDVEFLNWAERGDLCDGCVYRSLQAQGSQALRKALARAEVIAGRSVNERVIGRG